MASLNKINPHSAGIDIGSSKIFIAIEDSEVKSFNTFTDDYLKAIAYLKEHNVTSVAMEATGIYWIPLFEMLEASGIEVCLVNARDVKNVPGRKSDVQDCQWIQQLHCFGLLRPCFIPDDAIRQLRTYVRLRNDHISLASQHIQHMQKALDLMNIKLHNVISQIHGKSGMRVLNAIINGEQNPEVLADLCEDSILRKKRSQVIASLKGNFRTEHIFALQQAVDAYQFYQLQILKCDKQIEALLEQFTDDKPIPPDIRKPKAIRHNPPKVNQLHRKLMILTEGKDPTTITGMTDKNLLEVIAATGLNLESTWKTKKHFVSWMALCPNMHQSGKSNKKRKLKKHSTAGQIFIEAAMSIANSKYSALSGFYKRIQAKKGRRVALKATARKIAERYYDLMTKGIDYVEHGLEVYQQKFKEQQLKRLHKQAKLFNLQLSPLNVGVCQ
jgi:transposase